MKTVHTRPLYQPNGIQAFGWVMLIANPTAGLQITVNGDVYSYGVDFVGLSAAQALRSFCEAVNADQDNSNEVNLSNTNFGRAYYAVMNGQYAVIYAVVPGTGGNSITLASNNTGQAAISGATFSFGANGSASTASGTGALTNGGGTITAANTSQQIFAANPNRQYLFIQNQSAHNMYINFGAAATQDGNSILLVPNGSAVYESNYIPNGTITIIGTTIGDAFAAKQA